MSEKIFKEYQYDIALEEGVGPHLVAWVSGLMVFFVTLALAINFSLTALTQGWTGSLANTLTVEIKPPLPTAGEEKISAERQKAFDVAIAEVMTTAKQDPASKAVKLLGKDEVAALIEPWLGHKISSDIPLPALIDIKLAPDGDVEGLQADLLKVAPDAVIDNHAGALQGVSTLAGTARLFVLLLTGVIVALAIVSVAGIVRAKFSIHGQEVETLHLIGASDEYIARQFRRHTLRGALQGALLGLFAMVVVILAVGAATHTISASIVPRLRLIPVQWFLLTASPVLLGTLIAHLTAQRAVMKELAKLP